MRVRERPTTSTPVSLRRSEKDVLLRLGCEKEGEDKLRLVMNG